MRTKNVLAIIVPSILLGACATGAASADRVPQTPVLTGQGELSPVNPRLPDADQQIAEIREDSGDVASALVNFCVAPDGHVDRVNLLRRSSSPAYDMALMRDVADWQFTGEAPDPSRPETCESATVIYHLPL
jgi:TonB family protein